MELKELDIEKIKAMPIFEDRITEDGKVLTGQYFVGNFMLNLEDGLLCNDIWSDGEIFPALQGPGYHEFRDKGILNNPDDWRPARVISGFKKREFWEDGKLIKETGMPEI